MPKCNKCGKACSLFDLCRLQGSWICSTCFGASDASTPSVDETRSQPPPATHQTLEAPRPFLQLLKRAAVLVTILFSVTILLALFVKQRGPSGCYTRSGTPIPGDPLCFSGQTVQRGSRSGRWHWDGLTTLIIEWDKGTPKKQVLEWKGNTIEVLSSDGEQHFARPTFSRLGL